MLELLKKFKSSRGYGYNLELFNGINIDYYGGKFTLYNSFTNENIEISKTTVESLIKDLERK